MNCGQIAVKCWSIPSQILVPDYPFSLIDLSHSHEKTACAYGRVNLSSHRTNPPDYFEVLIETGYTYINIKARAASQAATIPSPQRVAYKLHGHHKHAPTA